MLHDVCCHSDVSIGCINLGDDTLDLCFRNIKTCAKFSIKCIHHNKLFSSV